MTAMPLLALLMAAHAPASIEGAFDKTWDEAAEAIRSRYYARTERKTEMERLLTSYAPRAKAARTAAEFSAALNAMIHEFGDSHFAHFTPDDQGYYLMDALSRPKEPAEMPHIGAWFRPGPDGYTVQMVLEGGEAANAGLRKGDVVTRANGAPFSPIASLRRQDRVRLVVRRGRQELTKEVGVQTSSAVKAFLDASRESARVIERGGRKFGYFHLWTQSGDEFRNALQGAALGKLHDTDGFILDLRDGFGGRPEGYGDPFFRPEVNLDWGVGGRTLRQPYGYGRPLVVLINEGSRSAKEVLAYIFKKSGRATLVGTRTAGHVLGTSPMRLSDGSYLEIPMVTVKADGRTLEDNGVEPDVRVPREYDEEGRDLVLEEGLRQLERKGVRR